MLKFSCIKEFISMENNELLYLCMVAFTCYGFNLAQGLRAAINRGDTVRITPKILCFVFCISVSIIAINIMIDSPYSSFIIYLHTLIMIFQSAMIWYSKPD